jgi:hypothetical protein
MSLTDIDFQLPPGTLRIAADRIAPPISPYLSDPAKWVHDKCGRHLWSKQVEILNSVRDHRMTAVQSCHGPGKSFTGSGVVGWWLDEEVHQLGSAFAVTTAPSWPQVEAILWREIRRRFNEGRLRGRITLDCQWHMGSQGSKRGDSSEEMIGMGRKPADYDEDTFQGIHARYFLALLDEACGIPESLWNSVLALVTNENARVLALGNPDDPNSRFEKICRPGSGWNVIKISVWDTPLFTGEDHCAICNATLPVDMMESLVSPQWVTDRRRDWGEGSPIWVSKVDGEFPDTSDEYLISPALVAAAQANDLPGFDFGRFALDVARYGEDKSVIYRNRGGVIRLVDSWGKTDTMGTAGKAAAVLRRFPTKRPAMNVDIVGVGAGVFDRLREQSFNVGPFQGSQRATNPAKFKNRRAEVWWNFKMMMEENLIDLDPSDDKLAAQLASVKWGVDSAGRIFIEAKEDIRDRGLPSPDHADSAVMSTVEVGNVPMSRPGGDSSLTGDLLTKTL